MKKKVKILIICLIVIVLIGCSLIILFLNQEKPYKIKKEQVEKFFDATINCKLDNKLNCNIEITPVFADKKYNDIEIVYIVSTVAKSNDGVREIDYPLSFTTDPIKLKKDGTYKGKIEADIDTNLYTSVSDDGFSLYPIKISGTIQ